MSHAQRLIGLFEEKKIDRERIVISVSYLLQYEHHPRDSNMLKIPASEEGIAAAQMLEKQCGIRTNLYLVSGFLHALICVEACTSTITFSCSMVRHLHTFFLPIPLTHSIA